MLKRFGRSVAVGWVALAAVGCGSTIGSRVEQRELAQKKYELGSDYFYKRMWEPAMAEALKAVELDPENADARNLVGALLMQKGIGKIQFIEGEQCIKGRAADMVRKEADGSFVQAREQFKAAVAARPGDPRALHNLAVVAMHFKQYDAAIANEQKALESPLFTDKHLARGELGWAYYHRDDYVSALKELLEALRLEPRYCVGYYRLAQVHYAMAEKSPTPLQDYDNALAALEKVNSKTCHIQEAEYLRGLTYIKKRESAKAVQPFSDCIKLAPRSCLSAECQRYRDMLKSTTAAP